MHVIGTAGHVDHGKSSLVRALTGTDPDRLAEEQRRGMTIDLGFAHLRYDDGVEAGIVDVPGHERFIHNMLAGASGMELLLLVISLAEGVREQTREHLEIARLLGLRHVFVALTHADRLDEHARAHARDAVRADLDGTIAADAPMYAVGTPIGLGVETLRAALHDALVQLPAPNTQAPAYLAIDRAFALPGHGTVVTGTLAQGSLHVGDSLLIHPGAHAVRVRALETFGDQRDHVDAGSRVAVNLGGIDVGTLERGAVLAEPGIASARAWRMRLEPARLGVALPTVRRLPVRLHVGAAEVFGTLLFDHAADAQGEATIHLREDIAVIPGGRCIVRRMSPKSIIAGGTFEALGAADTTGTTADPIREAVLAVVTAATEPLASETIAARANVRIADADAALGNAVEEGVVWLLARPAQFLSAPAAMALVDRARAALGIREAATPWVAGTTSLALAHELAHDESLLMRILAVATERGVIARVAGYYRTPGFVPTLTPEQREFFGRLIPPAVDGGLAPVEFAAVDSAMRAERVTGLATAIEMLFVSRELTRIGEHIYRREQLAEIRTRLEGALRAEGRITMAGFRDVVGTTRKYAVPLLEFFDASGVTVRDGDERALRSR